MSLNPPPLADQIASLRAATAAVPQGGWLLSSLHALILALFDRIFGRLEHVLLLWQSGQLPLPAPPAAARISNARRSPSANAHTAASPRGVECRSAFHHFGPEPTATTPSHKTSNPRPASSQRASIAPALPPRIRPARAPPEEPQNP